MKYFGLCILVFYILACLHGCHSLMDDEAAICYAYTVLDSENQDEIPLIVIFSDSSWEAESCVLYFIRKDGMFIWSKNQWEGGPPYYRGKLPKEKLAALKKELQFLKTINHQVRFIQNYNRPPDYGFGVMNIHDQEILMSVLLVSEFTSLGFYVPLDEQEKEDLMKELQQQRVLSDQQLKQSASRLWDYLTEILEKYVPAEGQKVDDMSFQIKSVEYMYRKEQ